MNQNLLPKTIDPIRMAKEGRILHGALALQDMARLCAVLAKNVGEVSVTLEFGVDTQGYKYIHGSFSTVLCLQCQRCMLPFEYPIQAEFNLSPVSTDRQAELLPAPYEPVMVSEQPLDTISMLEDEILLQLPLVAMHEPQQCSQTMPQKETNTELEEDSNNPFNILKELKKKDS